MNNILFEKVKPIDKLSDTQKPLWGIMTAHHMVEHLISSIKASDGKIILDLCVPPEKLAILKRILLSNRPLPKNFKNPVLPEQPLPIEIPNFFFAKQKLFEEISYFYSYYKKNPDQKHTHPSFGVLNMKEWEILHIKHFQHHLSQFGL